MVGSGGGGVTSGGIFGKGFISGGELSPGGLSPVTKTHKYILCLVGTACFICRENCRHAKTLVL